jgi:NADH:ubiquinone oxidoreductase subunit 5 (subunit L)/multisubunit Na+/H+ antiporter MnhA subunit
MWGAMLLSLLLHGVVVVSFLGVYGRWLDEEVVADMCLVGLIFELITAALTTQYLQTTDAVFFLGGGAVLGQWALPQASLNFCFDELTGFFVSILVLALILCFFFLIEYFEFDTNATSIILLSAAFSQVALLYFVVWDLCLLFFLWEVISLISFLLIQHWSFRLTSFKAGLKVFTVSQFGDLPFFLFLFLVLGRLNSSDLAEILASLPLCTFEYLTFGLGVSVFLVHFLTLLGCLLQVAIFLKAAQWFFYPWLLDAMEAPVPISAQLHSSTLVVIGFYLFFRFYVLFDLAPFTKKIFLSAGLVTSIGASVLGFYQDDGKKLLACSTAGQLGYVMVSLGLELYGEALCLLVFCCCNKALTFVWFGTLMQRYSGLSDLRRIGGSPLAGFEHAGMVISVANFTIVPGGFCWHVKGLFSQGALPWKGTQWEVVIGLGLLQMTWFLSSLYLFALYYNLFFGMQLGGKGTLTGDLQRTYRRNLIYRHVWREFRCSDPIRLSGRFVSWVWLCMYCVVWYGSFGGLLFMDVAWVGSLGGVVEELGYF